jgi:branched-chain amino acid aminotransferase
MTLTFGKQTTPHMLLQSWKGGAWQAPAIQPYGALAIDPLAKGLHYGQSVFEGMKAFRQPDGSVALFRPEVHLQRLNISADRLCMPAVEVEALLAEMRRLIDLDSEYVPNSPGSLYVRPLFFSDHGALVPEPSSRYLLAVMLLPVGPYIDKPEGLRLRTQVDSIRAAPGGMGAYKCAGNYAGALRDTYRAKEEGFDEVVWLDASERRFLEEVGTMNLFIVRKGRLVTPPLGDTILPGITRRTLITLAQDRGIDVAEERISVDAGDWSSVEEVLTCGTAVGVMGVRELRHLGTPLFAAKALGPVTTELAQALHGVRYGTSDEHPEWRTRAR